MLRHFSFERTPWSKGVVSYRIHPWCFSSSSSSSSCMFHKIPWVDFFFLRDVICIRGYMWEVDTRFECACVYGNATFCPRALKAYLCRALNTGRNGVDAIVAVVWDDRERERERGNRKRVEITTDERSWEYFFKSLFFFLLLFFICIYIICQCIWRNCIYEKYR